MIAYVDTQIGNVGSLLRAFAQLSVTLERVRCPEDLDAAQAIILPGVGQRLVEPLRRGAQRGQILFGICLGMQLIFDTGEEHGAEEGLRLLRGTVRRLCPNANSASRVPNIGWCDVSPTRASTLFPKGSPGCCYFVHSYCVAPSVPVMVTATMEFGGEVVPVAIEQDNLFGVQFHPEKSQDDGLAVLAAFLAHLRATGRRIE